jgi:glycosyltransferase involved in cell wall biosynthesis
VKEEVTMAASADAPSLAGEPPFRVLCIEANEDGTVGGTHRVVYDLVMALDRSRFEPVVLYYQDNVFAERLRSLGVHVATYDATRSAERNIRLTGGRVAKLVDQTVATPVRRLRFLIEARIDLIHVANSPRACNDDWLPAARLLGIPCVVSVSGDASGADGGAVRRWLFRSFDRYLSVSRYIDSAMREAGVDASRLDLVYPGVDLESFRARLTRSPEEVRAELGVGRDGFLAVMVGNVREWKGQHVVLDALAALPETLRRRMHVVFAGAVATGDGAYRARLDARVEEAGLGEQVAFLGNRDDVPDLMNAADLVLHASIKPEPFGLVVVEAMAVGTPVIAANRGGPAEVIAPGSGLTFDPTRPVDLAAALTELIEDPALRARLSAGARQRAEQFAAGKYAAIVQDIYDAVLRARPRQRPLPHLLRRPRNRKRANGTGGMK